MVGDSDSRLDGAYFKRKNKTLETWRKNIVQLIEKGKARQKGASSASLCLAPSELQQANHARAMARGNSHGASAAQQSPVIFRHTHTSITCVAIAALAVVTYDSAQVVICATGNGTQPPPPSEPRTPSELRRIIDEGFGNRF